MADAKKISLLPIDVGFDLKGPLTIEYLTATGTKTRAKNISKATAIKILIAACYTLHL